VGNLGQTFLTLIDSDLGIDKSNFSLSKKIINW